MEARVKIGISAKFHSKAPVFYGGESNRHIQYIETSVATWVSKNGGLPFMIPSESIFSDFKEDSLDAASFAEEMDALILQGGVDIDPSLYEPGHTNTSLKTDKARDIYEIKLLQEFIKRKKPVLGICRGMQLINVLFGGTLYSDLEAVGKGKHIDTTTEHKFKHDIQIEDKSHLSKIYDKNQTVVSVHHQGIKDLAKDLTVEAKSSDGLIEAFSLINKDNFILAVQWHPEFHDLHDTQEMNSGKLFELLLNSAKNRKFFGHLNSKSPKSFSKPDSLSLSLGVELELQVIDLDSQDLSPSVPDILLSTTEYTNKIKTEIFQSMIEVETGICNNANEVEKDLKESLQILIAETKKRNLGICSLGTHPFAKYNERILTENDRYKNLVDSKQWIARRIAIFGLHCHVGAKDSTEAIELYRFYLSVAPLLLAISASSPYFQGEDTGLSSVRSTFFESTPAGGHPPIISSWNEFEGLLTKLFKSKSITSHKDLWWDVRPSLSYGTIEIRICDMMPTLKENSTLIALIHLLGHCYLKYKNEFKWPTVSEWAYRENKWRALRYGTGFEFIINEDGLSLNSKEYILNLLENFQDEIHDLNYESQIEFLKNNMLDQNPAQKLVELKKSGLSLSDIVSLYISNFENSVNGSD